jgi:hypothetical protein
MYKAMVDSQNALSLPSQVRVEDDKETRLPSGLVLKPVATLRVTVSPAEDPDAKPWRIRLVALRGPSRATIEAQEPVGPDGRWSRERLPAGTYDLKVLRADGSSWHTEQVELEAGANLVDVSPGRMRVTGSIRLGSDPLKATLVLGDRSARVSATFESDAKGGFQGWLPQLDVGTARWFVRVNATDPQTAVAYEEVKPERVSEGEAHFALAIPDKTIEGTVVDETGIPQAATVTALPLAEPSTGPAFKASEPFQVASDPKTGKFVIRGLAPAEHSVFARAYRPGAGFPGAARTLLESEVTKISLDSEASARKESDLTLVLRPAGAVTGWVHTPDGVGIANATVFVSPSQAPFNPIRPATTSAQGRFSADVPANTSSVMVLVEAVGVGWRMTRLAMREGEPLDLALDPASSGVLTLEADPALDYGPVFVYHDGAFDSLRALERWAQVHGESAPGQLRAPLMSPGSYRLCMASGLRDAYRVGFTSEPTERCAEGYLAPAGELRLSVPVPPGRP